MIGRLVRLVACVADHRFDWDRRRHIRECSERERRRVVAGIREVRR